jgi:hypothetical protein
VKKTVFRFIVVLAMISAIFLAPAVHAQDSTNIPYDYLYPEEQTFVTQVRAYVLIAKIKLDTAQTNLDTAMLQDMSVWRAEMLANLNALNNSMADISKIDTPVNFISIGDQLKGLGKINTAYFGSMADASSNLVDFAQTLATLNDGLKRVGANLDKISQNLEKEVRDIAKQREQNEKALGSFITSCMSES